jgi:hypothetical protein
MDCDNLVVSPFRPNAAPQQVETGAATQLSWKNRLIASWLRT